MHFNVHTKYTRTHLPIVLRPHLGGFGRYLEGEKRGFQAADGEMFSFACCLRIYVFVYFYVQWSLTW